ncbi:MAG: organic solvent transporter substrate-binding protein [Acidimicrobiales bacterium]|nr:organic solvent transporter substrate-binding protein [Acidimicrobiales bacterium]
MKSFRDRNPYAVGIGSILFLGLAVGIAFAVGILHVFEHGYTVQGVFTDASGIRKGADVRVAGVKAGRVESIHADRSTGKVVIKFLVHRGVHVNKDDVRAEVALQTLLGQRFIRLTTNAKKPYLENVPTAARIIPADRTKTPFDIFDLTKIATRSIQATDTEKLNTFIKDLADITQGKHDQLAELLTGVDKVSTAIDSREAQLRSLFDRLDGLSKLLADKDQTLAGLLDQSQAILDLVDRRRADIAKGINDTNTVAQRLGDILTTQRAQLDAILTTVDNTVGVIDARTPIIDRSLSWIGAGALGLSKAASHGPWQDIYVRSVGPDLIQIINDALHPKAATP